MNEDESIDPDPEETREVQVRVIDESGESPADDEAVEEIPVLQVPDEPVGDGVKRRDSSKLKSLSVRRSSEAASAEPSPEYGELDKKGLGTTGMTVVMGASATFLVVAGVVTVMLFRNQDGVEPPDAVRPAPVRVVEDSAPEELYDKMAALEGQARDVVAGYSGAKNVDEVIPFLRESKNLASLLADQWQHRELREGSVKLVKIDLIEPAEPVEPVEGEDEADYLQIMMEGVTLEGEIVNFILVHDAKGLLLDWKASFGIGDRTFEGVRQIAVDEEAEMRVLVSRDNYFNSTFPESDYYCYSLEDRAEEKVMWGYVPKGSMEKDELSTHLREGSRFFRTYRNLPVTLKLKNTGSAGTGQFLISEVVGNSWIEP